jgi:hypothetical protein
MRNRLLKKYLLKSVALLAILPGASWMQQAHAQQFPADKLTISAESKSTLTDEAGAKILTTDLSAPHEGNWFQGTPIASLNWIELPAGRYIVRYRAAVDHVGAANVSLWGEVFSNSENKTRRSGWNRWLGVDFQRPGQLQNLDVTVDLPAEAQLQPRFLWRRSTKDPGDIRQIKLASIEIIPNAKTLLLIDALSNKVHYKEDEAGGGWAKVLNASAAPQSARLVAKIYSDLDATGQTVFDKVVTVAPQREATFTFAFPKMNRYGAELRVELRDPKTGALLGTRSDYFTVLNNVLEVGLSAEPPFRAASGDGAMSNDIYPFGFKGQPTDAWYSLLPKYVEGLRRRYHNTSELFAWGPWDAIKLVPDGEDWQSGQTKYRLSRTRTKMYIDEFHKNGMTVQLYNQSLWGISSDYLQEHPEYYAYNAEGKPQGLDIHHTEPVDEHIAGLLKSIEVFGWDGVRWDGHFDYVPPYDNLKTLLGEPIDTSKRDEQVAQINDHIRQEINAKYPLFTWGYNWSDQVESFQNSHEIKSLSQNGSWILNEVLKDSESPTSGTHKWTDYAHRITSGQRVLQRYGGLYLGMKPPQYFAAGSQVLYATLLIYAARAYCYGAPFLDRAPLDADLNAFMTRYALYLRGREYSALPDASTLMSVKSPHEVWWKEYLAQRKTEGGVEQVLGLINPPVTEAITNAPEGKLPAVQNNLEISAKVPPGMTRVSATLLSPDRKPFQAELTVKLNGGAATMTIPELRYWDVVVLRWSR